ncbi:MAG: DTW domain-containing protein [Vitreoscilla sp.]|nr:DTW domain-containing protein [Vitreoscilla sp.]MBP6673847.1 DTW domain-containing protein [Vitreoscilla sp.]
MPFVPPTSTPGAVRAASRRANCHRCHRPQLACVCVWACPVDNTVPVLFLQHPSEVGHAKGTVDLLRLSLARCQVHVGEVVQPDDLKLGNLSTVALLYPDATGGSGLVAEPAISSSLSRLLVLDGTWRKTHRMLCSNPWLAALPRVSLSPATVSAYRVRRARHVHQLSTLEATCLAMGQLEGEASRYAGLLQGMEGFVAAIASRMPQRTAATEPEPATLDLTLPGLPE